MKHIEYLPYYVFNDMINIKNFDPNLLSINKISLKNKDVLVYEIKTYHNGDLIYGDLI